MLPLPPLPARFNVVDYFLAASAPGDAARPYVVSEEGALTRRGLDEQSSRIGYALRRLGVDPEQRVALLMSDALQFPPCFWAVLRIGAVAVPVNPLLTPAEMRGFLADSRARALIVDPAPWPPLAPLARELRHLRHVILARGAAPGLPSLADLAERESASMAGEPLSPDDPACWLYTSGSTGQPKAAVHLVRDLVHAARIFPQWIGISDADVTFSAPRMHFAYGLGNSLLFPLATGGTAVIQHERPTPENVLRTLQRFRPNIFFAGPALLQGMIDHLAGRAGGASAVAAQLDFVRFTVSAGEAVPPPLYREWRETFGHEILDCVGSTENLTFFLANRPGQSRAGSSGHPVPGFDLKLVDELEREVPRGEPGTLWVRGPTAAARYWNRQALSRAVLRGAWLVTGDRFRVSADGSYEFLGRDDDMLKVGGSWVSPAEVERVLLAHPGVSECAVVGRRDGSGLGQAAAFVVLRPGAGAPRLTELLQEHLRANLAEFKVPRWIEIVPALPRTATGKIQRFRLRAS